MSPAVLVVEDNEDIRLALEMLLEDEGYSVRKAGDGREALRVLRASRDPMVVLLDFMLPRLSGDGVLAAVAQEPNVAARCAFILCTALDRTLPLAFVKLLAELGVEMVPKPFNAQALLDAVAAAAGRLATP